MNANKLQLVLAADMTYSMAAIRNEIRRAMERDAAQLSSMFPGVEIGVIFFGDDVNRQEVYSEVHIGLTSDVTAVGRFISSAKNANGGGPHANYERALAVANQMKWDASARKIVLVYGDEVPHEASFKHIDGTQYDWKFELAQLQAKGVTVCGVHCLHDSRPATRRFYEELAKKTGGSYLTLPQFNAYGDLLMAVAMQQLGVDHLRTYRSTLEKENRLTRPIDANIARLGGFDISSRYATGRADGLVPVPQGQLLLITADEDIAMPKLMAANGIADAHNVERYYEFRKAETIQGNKKIVLVEKATGDIFTGDAARQLMGLPQDNYADVRLKKKDVAVVQNTYDIYVESQSNNRNIPAGQRILVDLSQRTKRRAR